MWMRMGTFGFRGHQVEAAIAGLGADQVAGRRADASALVAVLYLCLTTHWPSDLLEPGRAARRVPPPSHLVADVPSVLDALVRRGADGYTDVREVTSELAVARERLTSRRSVAHRERLVNRGLRAVAIGVGVLAITAHHGGHHAGITGSRKAVWCDWTPMTAQWPQTSIPRPNWGPARRNSTLTRSSLDPDGDGSEYPQPARQHYRRRLRNRLDDQVVFHRRCRRQARCRRGVRLGFAAAGDGARRGADRHRD